MVFKTFGCGAHFKSELHRHGWIDLDNLRMKFLTQNVHFNNLSFDLLNLRSLAYLRLKFGYPFNTHCYFIARCTLIAKVAGLLLSHVT